MPWNMMESPTTPGTSTVAKADSAPGTLEAADALTDLRKDVEEDEAQEERLHQRAHDELDQVLAQDDEVAQDQRAAARSSWRRWPSGWARRHRRAACGPTTAGSDWSGAAVVVISRAGPFRSGR